MKLSLPFFKKKTPHEKIFLGVFLKEQSGVVFYFRLHNGSILRKIAQEKFSYTNGWENLTEDVDEALYKLEMQEKVSPEETIFFVYSHLVDSETKDIKKPYLFKIKDLVKRLELKPLGYIDCHEALVDYLNNKEQISLTAIIIEFDSSTLTVFVYKGGRLIFQESLSRTQNTIDDLTPIFEKIKNQSVLPTRIILYNSKDLGLEAAKIVSYRWGEDYFIQLPKVDIVGEQELSDSLFQTFSQQIVSSVEPIKKVEEKHEMMGFVIGDDVKPKEKESEIEEEPLSKKPIELSQLTSSFFSVFSSLLKKAKDMIPSKNSFPRLLLPGVGVFLILGGFFLLEFYFHRATVTLSFVSQKLSRDISVVGDDLKIMKKEETIKLTTRGSTSGKRSIGEKARGEVTVHNFDDKEKTFEASTTIESQGLRFVLDSTAKVASSSLAADASAKLPGKQKVKVTATEIGPEGNLSKNQRFKIADLSTSLFFAINENEFLGGTKRDIRTVSKEDMDKLKNDVLKKAKEYLNSKIEKSIGNENKLLKQLSTVELAALNYSKELGEEEDVVELSSKAKITYFFYRDKELLDRLANLFKKDLKEGFTIPSENIKYTIKEVKNRRSEYTLQISSDAKAIRKLDTDKITGRFVGKASERMEEQIAKDYNISKIEYTIDNPIPFLRNFFPFFKKNIDLKIIYL